MSKQDEIRKKITSKIVDAIKSGNLPPWRKPWSNDGNVGFSLNVVSKRSYSGINPLILECANMRHGFGSKWWGTMKQWNDLGGRIQKRPDHVEPGKWATTIVYWSPVTKKQKDSDGNDKEERFFFMKTYQVFNIDQVDGKHLDHLRAGNAPLTEEQLSQRYELAEQATQVIPAKIRFGGNQAYYTPSEDRIQMPFRHQFESADAYYETLGHELCHWSEDRTKWDRKKEGYAAGELRAEIGACFWCSELGLGMGDFDQSCTYLKGWLEKMEQDPSFIFKTSAQASKAVDYLLSFSRKAEPVEELVA